MASNVIFTDNLDKYEPIKWGHQELYKYYSQLKNFLRQQIGDKYANIFAEPFVSLSSSKIRWLSEVVGSNAVRLTSLPAEEQVLVKNNLSASISYVSEFAEKLRQSGQKDAIMWSEIINLALNIPSLDYVYSEGENIVILAWGFTNRQTNTSNFKLSKGVLAPVIAPQEVSTVFTRSDEDVLKPEKKEEVDTPPQGQEISTLSQEPSIMPPQKEDTNKKKKSIFKKLWFWLLFIFIILLLLMLPFVCKEKNVYLPGKEGVMPPIDTTKIVEDPNGRPIVSNQLILYIGSHTKTVDELATDFKQLYPSDDYKVIYYNRSGAKRINIEFPQREKKAIKENLIQNLKDYNLVIVDETIFNNEMLPPDPGFTDNNKNWSYQAVKAYSAWDVTTGDKDIIVAIIDDGFDLSHPEFSGKIISPYNIPASNSSPTTYGDKLFHGTHVAATAIGNINNSQGLCGVAPNCGFMPVQVADKNGNMSTTAIIDAIFYALDNGADVINMSLGIPAMPGMENISAEAQEEFIKNTYLDDQELWEQIFKVVDNDNVTVILAGGNENVLIGIDPMQRYSNTIKVSAVNPNMQKAEFSNYGKYSTISAPGVEIFSALPDDKFGFLQGTSMAAPMVAGGVALLKSENPNLTNHEIINILQSTGLPLSSKDGYIGNLMQLSAALNAEEGLYNTVECPEVQREIDSLLQVIEDLKKGCSQKIDTTNNLIIPDNPTDYKFTTGVWKSTTNLYNANTDEPVELYFNLNGTNKGKLTFLEQNGNKCYADLTLSLNQNTLIMEQIAEAMCDNSDRYLIHVYTCKPEANNVANCLATTSDGNKLIDFKLTKIKE